MKKADSSTGSFCHVLSLSGWWLLNNPPEKYENLMFWLVVSTNHLEKSWSE